MQEPEYKLKETINPLYGFGGKQVVAFGKISMPQTFG
jgi:hypothetical protein